MRSVIIAASILFLTACGGSSGARTSTSVPSSPASSAQSSMDAASRSVMASSLASSSSAAAELVIDEDTPLEIRPIGVNEQFSVYVVDTSKLTGQLIPVEAKSRRGGIIKISFDAAGVIYIPPKNFYGDDEFYYWLNGSGINKKIKVSVQVLPVEDTELEISFNENRFYVAGDIVPIGALVNVDTNEVIEPDASTQLFINAVAAESIFTSSGISLIVPALERAGVQTLVVEQEVNGEKVRVEKELLVKRVDGDVTYYHGSKDAPGQSVVLVWTKGTEVLNPASWMERELGSYLKIPLHLTYAPYFNISAIKPLAEKKLYPGTVNADFDYYSQFVRKYDQSNMQMVIMVDGIGGGNAAALVTMDPQGGARILLHELGHLHAGLGDEYTQAVLNFGYDSGYPNVTRFLNGDLAQVPWRHWLRDENRIPGIHVDPVSDIETGIFEGAHYTIKGIYRPSKNSVMNRGAELGEVNAEAWALANYKYLELFLQATEEIVNARRVITLKSDWDKKLTRIDWYLDEVLQDNWTNLARIEIDESALTSASYTVRVEAVDVTGYIKDTHPYMEVSPGVIRNPSLSKAWKFKTNRLLLARQKQSSQVKGQAHDQSLRWVNYSIAFAGGVHRIESRHEHALPDVLAPVAVTSDLMVDLVVDGEVRYRQGIDLQQFDVAPINIPERAPAFHYRVAHPAVEGSYALRIYELPERALMTEFFINRD